MMVITADTVALDFFSRNDTVYDYDDVLQSILWLEEYHGMYPYEQSDAMIEWAVLSLYPYIYGKG
jgi:hypothetical protein